MLLCIVCNEARGKYCNHKFSLKQPTLTYVNCRNQSCINFNIDSLSSILCMQMCTKRNHTKGKFFLNIHQPSIFPQLNLRTLFTDNFLYKSLIMRHSEAPLISQDRNLCEKFSLD